MGQVLCVIFVTLEIWYSPKIKMYLRKKIKAKGLICQPGYSWANCKVLGPEDFHIWEEQMLAVLSRNLQGNWRMLS